MSDTLAMALVYLFPLVAILAWYIHRSQRRNRHNRALQGEAVAAGLHEPSSLHPLVDPAACIGCGACVRACPEHDVLGLINGRVELLEAANCVGHGACERACPVGAIQLVFGTETRGVDIPLLSPEFETTVPGVFIAGELGGMGLIRNAIEQGRQAMIAIIARGQRPPQGVDVVVVGAGPAGLAAALEAKAAGFSCLVLDQEQTLGGTVAHFPRGKLVMTRPVELPLVGQVRFTETSKESLLGFWHEVLRRYPLDIRFGQRVEAVTVESGHFRVTTPSGHWQAGAVLLAIGRRGSPRRLDIPGEDSNKVVYRLIDPEQYRGQSLLVVGGGDSALEAAASLAELGDTVVCLAHRGEAFNRAKSKNRERVSALQQAGRLHVLLSTRPTQIHPDRVVLQGPAGEQVLVNDSVIICAGGVLPDAFLKSIGIAVETKYGTA